jgi:hypothetical protein
MKLKNCGRIVRHELSNEIETIEACQSLDDLQEILSCLDARQDLSPADERVLRPHLQAAASCLLALELCEVRQTVSRSFHMFPGSFHGRQKNK